MLKIYENINETVLSTKDAFYGIFQNFQNSCSAKYILEVLLSDCFHELVKRVYPLTYIVNQFLHQILENRDRYLRPLFLPLRHLTLALLYPVFSICFSHHSI